MTSGLLIASTGLALAGWVFSGHSGAPTVVTRYQFTGTPQTYVVQTGVCRVRIEALGAAGGPEGTAGTPGPGAIAISTFVVTPGETLRVNVGGQGGEAEGSTLGVGGWNGGGAGGRAADANDGRLGQAGSGGGGATDVRRGGDGLEHRIIVAGGGSGGAGGGIGGPIGTAGGDGGDLAGGGDGFAVLGTVNPATGGKGGSQTTGGPPGTNAPRLSSAATAGSLGVGGNGAPGGISGGGGGGGGLYGGGGGGATYSPLGGGQGGGGSGYGPPNTTFRTGVWGSYGSGRATVSYDPAVDMCRPPATH